MCAEFPDAETIRSALMLAGRAPSVHNTQPWRWRVGEHSLHLYADRDLLLPHTDPDARDLMLSCGAALHHCAVALAALGWQSRIERFPDPADPDHLAAIELHRYPASENDVALAAAIPRRRTDRRTYSPWPVPERDIALMGARAARAGVLLRRLDSLDHLIRIVADAARQHRTDAEYLTELTIWSGRYASTAGVPARNAPMPDGSAPIPPRTFAGAALPQPDVDAAQDGATVIALGTVADDDLARLRAGEAASLVMLTATAQGLASCPITEPLEISETRAAVQADVFGPDAYPQMLLRIGWAPINADPLPSTPRRALAEWATRVDGSAL
ncbi:putative NAD(P)H nitroreductase [Mycolicibacterium hassiacum DSM 44199]|jgi:nitroreductase|uniref:Putative NAD(P)H nitroreductase n=1 Tax=Mycolicibacterium hassiacum (strain DSM 44199 / CIP 105218 / JCM 12690 / 3849) TaxID=1122247 RepID=K5BH42_MYCHD|nr:nitroreductase family protein [Mycolicibacterium hassiacum]EKF24556.1 putative NAD(P)H nitroreductase [Mycolicibacterium hassiacum DSM 44199]MBX5488068.1 NAD(P)H nitroreductase [Mycolicibacterium hassiacum]PZN22824.1 MAG: NAD(P)H nitroreductase [Mycolicibacterium hassiacum]VCT88996.1 Putative NAD(P)H nitroreductase [Mycolicibacterium hassiacum DSM 44199]